MFCIIVQYVSLIVPRIPTYECASHQEQPINYKLWRNEFHCTGIESNINLYTILHGTYNAAMLLGVEGLGFLKIIVEDKKKNTRYSISNNYILF